MNQNRHIWVDSAIVILLFLVVFGLSYQSLGSRTIDGSLDSAANIMDGLYFHDLIMDHPANPMSYTLNYYRQYPALGFVCWPPLFPFVMGIGFLIGGLDIGVAHWCVMGFGLLMVLMAYLLARRTLSRTLSALAALVMVGTPLVGQQTYLIMRELPALAMGLATFYAYVNFVKSPGWRRAIVVAVVGAAALYTKQTILFIYPVVAIDVFVNRRDLLRDRRLWAAAALFLVLIAPLAVFTLTIAKVNVEQSLGSDPALNMMGVGRWNMAAWTFYPRALLSIVNPVLLLLCIPAFVYAIRRRAFLRANVLWFGWILVWLAVFSWLLAKETRHAILWIPGWCMLTAAFMGELITRAPRLKNLQWLLVVPVLMGAWETLHYHPPTYRGVEAVVNGIVGGAAEGNLMFFGRNRQLLVPYIRIKDTTRRMFTLQGDDVTAGPLPIGEVCREYRVRYVIGDREAAEFQPALSQIGASSEFFELAPVEIQPTWRSPFDYRVFRYNGPIAANMRSIPLNSQFVTARFNQMVDSKFK